MVSCLKPIYHPCPSRVWKEGEARKSFLQKAQSAATTIGGLVWALKPFSPFPSGHRPVDGGGHDRSVHRSRAQQVSDLAHLGGWWGGRSDKESRGHVDTSRLRLRIPIFSARLNTAFHPFPGHSSCSKQARSSSENLLSFHPPQTTKSEAKRMSIEGQYLLQTDPEADCKENTGVDCMGKWKLGLLSVFILFAFVAFVSTLRLLFDISPHLVVVLGLVAFLGVSLCNLRITREVS